MKIYNNLDQFTARNPVVTIGTFDGVHLGHRKVIDQLNRIASEVNGESVLFTFYPHPRLVVSKSESNLRLLTTLQEKTCLLEDAGIDHLVIYPFDEKFAALSYIDFIEQILIGEIGMHTLVVGYDHKLGRNREGTFDKLLNLSKFLKFDLKKIDALLIDAVDISSSKIRAALQEGNIQVVNNYLGYNFTIHGSVEAGNQVGRGIGFPTANIVASDVYKIIPAEGVYAVTAELNGEAYKAMLNIGYRPTLDKNADKRTIEAHLFDFNQDIYQHEITLRFYERIRDEKRFDSLDLLKTQLLDDKNKVLEILSKVNIAK